MELTDTRPWIREPGRGLVRPTETLRVSAREAGTCGFFVVPPRATLTQPRLP